MTGMNNPHIREILFLRSIKSLIMKRHFFLQQCQNNLLLQFELDGIASNAYTDRQINFVRTLVNFINLVYCSYKIWCRQRHQFIIITVVNFIQFTSISK